MDLPPIRYVRTSDGFDIAYTVAGEGRPLVFTNTAFSNLRSTWKRYSHWMQGLSERFRLIVYDGRGLGFSTRGLPSSTTLDDFWRDLEAIVDGLGLARVLLYAFAGQGHDAVRYACAHPERVDALIWNGAHATFDALPRSQFGELSRENWDLFLRSLAPPGLPIDEYDEWLGDTRDSVSVEDLTDVMFPLRFSSTVEKELSGLNVPLLVMHPRNDPVHPQQESMHVAALVPGARYVLIDYDRSNVHGRLHGDPVQGLAAIDAFLADLTHGPKSPNPGSLTPREAEVLELLAAGKTNDEIAARLVISRNTVRRHVSNILDKTGSANRAQAGAYARDHGLA